MNHFVIYLITRVDNFIIITGVVFIISIIVALFSIACYYIECEDDDDEKKKIAFSVIKKMIVVIAISAFFIVAVPNSKEIAAIYLIPKIINNENIQKPPDNLLRFLNKKVDEWSKENNGEKKN